MVRMSNVPSHRIVNTKNASRRVPSGRMAVPSGTRRIVKNKLPSYVHYTRSAQVHSRSRRPPVVRRPSISSRPHVIVQSSHGPVAVPVATASDVAHTPTASSYVQPTVSPTHVVDAGASQAQAHAASAADKLNQAIDSLHSIPVADEFMKDHGAAIQNIEAAAQYAQQLYNMFH